MPYNWYEEKEKLWVCDIVPKLIRLEVWPADDPLDPVTHGKWYASIELKPFNSFATVDHRKKPFDTREEAQQAVQTEYGRRLALLKQAFGGLQSY